MSPEGVFLPIVTPFFRGKVDLDSYVKLLRMYAGKGISGVIPLATTGEVPTIEEGEYLEVLDATIRTVGPDLPIYAGISSNSTHKAVHLIKGLEEKAVSGFLVTSPYYNLPSQRGILEHFTTLSGSTRKSILIYNIPYRTGRNIENETIFALAKLPNIIGIKDSCGIIGQSIELIRDRDPRFSVLTGEDILFHFNCSSGGSGGILASAHVNTEKFVNVYKLIKANDAAKALREWNDISGVIPLLFKEPNPAPIKHILARKGLIRSDEVRPPLAPISDALSARLDKLLAAGAL